MLTRIPRCLQLHVREQALRDRDHELSELRRRLQSQGVRFADSEARRLEQATAAADSARRTGLESEKELIELRGRVRELEAKLALQTRASGAAEVLAAGWGGDLVV